MRWWFISPLSKYVLTVDALGYVLEVSCQKCKIRGISLPWGEEMVNNHFLDDSLVSMIVDRELVSTTSKCLNLFCQALGDIISDNKSDYWIVGLDEPPTWIMITWWFLQLTFIAKYIFIPFGRDISPSSMFDWFLHKLHYKLLFWKCKDLTSVGTITMVSRILQSSDIYYVSC